MSTQTPRPSNERFQSLGLIIPYFIRNRQRIIFGLISLIIVDLAQLWIPRVIKRAVDDLTTLGATPHHLFRYALEIVVLAAIIGVFRFFWRHCLIGLSRKIEEGVRNQLFDHLQTLSASYFAGISTGDLMAHGTNDLKSIRMATGMGMVALADGIIMGTTALAFMAYINIWLTFLVFIPMPLIIFGTRFFSKRIHALFLKVQAAFSDLTEVVREQFTGIRVIKAYTMEGAAMERLRHRSRFYVEQNLKLVRITGAFFPMMMFFTNVSMGVVLFVGGRLTILGTISTGDFVAFISYLGLITWPMMAMGWVTNLVQRGKASLDRLNQILETQPDIRDSASARPISTFQKSIVMKNLGFTYPADPPLPQSPPVLSNIDLEIPKGSTLGIVGPPGSGKTTLITLIPRIYDVSSGGIFIDGIDIRDLRVADLRNLISFVPQEPFLFAGTIRDNITFGVENVQNLDQILTLSALESTIARFPKGLDTVVGEKGIILSGGQKQRVGLARALLKPAPILILDDPVSQVDMETGRQIIKGLQHLTGKRTLIIVSHRLSALKFADRIITLENGQITESGTHDQLMASGGYYARTCQLQSLEEEMFD